MQTVNIKPNEETRQLLPEYLDKKQAAEYGRTTTKKLALFRKYGLLKYAKVGQEYIYKKAWIDEFYNTWSCYDLSNEERIRAAIQVKAIRDREKTGTR